MVACPVPGARAGQWDAEAGSPGFGAGLGFAIIRLTTIRQSEVRRCADWVPCLAALLSPLRLAIFRSVTGGASSSAIHLWTRPQLALRSPRRELAAAYLFGSGWAMSPLSGLFAPVRAFIRSSR